MKKPNVVLITTDQMRADSYGVRNKDIITPNIDYLSTNGFDFENAYCTSPVCTPSRAAIFTGRYPHNTGAWNIGVALSEEEVTMADWFKKLGYYNVAIGKMHFRAQMKDHSGECGSFEDVVIRDRGRDKDGTYYGFDKHYITEDDKGGKYASWLKKKGIDIILGKGEDGINPLKEDEHQTYWIGKHSVDTVDEHDFEKKPLFMWTSFVDPHHPFDPLQKFVDIYGNLEDREVIINPLLHYKRPLYLQKQGINGYWPGGGEEHKYSHEEIQKIIKYYYAMISFVDHEIGKLLKALEKKGQLENTIIIFTSDHGEYLGDHGLLKKGPFLNDSLIKVPMLFYGKGVPKGRTEKLIENVDILPTVLELLEEDIPYGIQGVSQKELILGKVPRVRKDIVTTYDAHDRGIFIKAYRDEMYKLIFYQGEEYGELYDLLEDPKELKNIFFDEDYKDIKNKLITNLCHRLIKDSDPLPERKACW